MFLVEREPGNVAMYNSAADLTQAIRQGDVGPRARIFHRRSSQWLPITEHPAYRQARAEAEREPLPPLRRRHWTFLPGAPGAGDPRSGEAASKASPPQPEAGGQPAPQQAPAETRRPWWPASLRTVVARMRSRGRTERG
jgi:hypothetical protein